MSMLNIETYLGPYQTSMIESFHENNFYDF